MDLFKSYYRRRLIFALLFCLCSKAAFSQVKPDSDSLRADSLQHAAEKMLLQQQQQHQLDSVVKTQLQNDLQAAAGDKQKTKELQGRLDKLASADSARKAEQLQKIAELKKSTAGFPVVLLDDTLFYVYTKIGSFSARDRAAAVSQRIKKLYDDPFYRADSLTLNETDNGYDFLYNRETLILSVSNLDALWLGKGAEQVASDYLSKIKATISTQRQANSLLNWLKRIALAVIIFLCLGLLVFFINKFFKRVVLFINARKASYLNGFSIRKIKIFSAEQLQKALLRINGVVRIIVIILAVYLSLPLLFSIFPETKTWRDVLLGWILTPLGEAFSGVYHFLPHLFAILVIYFIFSYLIKGLKYFVDEVSKGNIHLTGFHPDWAQPTFNILKFLLYAFMIVLIFPYLPGHNSTAFQGVSVFVGVIFSLGSSSAISNMVAGLVITYMRPFKIGDRVRIGDITGDVMEKTMLVTRIRTIKNEDITVPNSTVLSSSTVNYSTNTKPGDSGLIVHTTITIGYDVPWKQMHEVLVMAALRTELILNDPTPFVLQTSLDDFYVSYQLNAYTKEANKQAVIYSQLHQHIQDCCNEAGIEIMSPHYRAARDGNTTTIPADYLSKDYKAPAFNVQVKQEGTEEKN